MRLDVDFGCAVVIDKSNCESRLSVYASVIVVKSNDASDKSMVEPSAKSAFP